MAKQWQATHSYKFTRPVSRSSGLAKPLQVALLFNNNQTMKGRKEILKAIGESNWKTRGQLACLFTALNWNSVIKYDKETKSYIQGRRYKEFLEYSLNLMTRLGIQNKHKTEYLTLLRETSQTLHFIMED